MKLDSLKDLYLDSLEDTYSAEMQAIKAYPKLMAKVTNPQLKAAMQEHLQQTQGGQIDRLKQIFKGLGHEPEEKLCHGMEGIMKEASADSQEEGAPEVLDVSILSQAQHAEHYEIAAYGSLAAYAKFLKRDDDVNLLEQTLNEEKQTDEKLTKLAESVINPEAVAA